MGMGFLLDQSRLNKSAADVFGTSLEECGCAGRENDSGIFRFQLRSCSVEDRDLLPRNALLETKSSRCIGHTFI